MKANLAVKARIRKKPNGIYYSHITILGKRYRKSTNTRIRQAALEFNLIHLKHLLK